jgi:hypothetical protein
MFRKNTTELKIMEATVSGQPKFVYCSQCGHITDNFYEPGEVVLVDPAHGRKAYGRILAMEVSPEGVMVILDMASERIKEYIDRIEKI